MDIWFDVTTTDGKIPRDLWKFIGILDAMKGEKKDIEFLFPLLLNSWAQFRADLLVGQDNEKEMERIMYHY